MTQSCKECTTANFAPVYILGAVVVAILLMFAALYRKEEQAFKAKLKKLKDTVAQVTTADDDTAEGNMMVMQRLHQHSVRVQRLIVNKLSINYFTFQVTYQYAKIVTGYEFEFHYPQPARSAVNYLSVFGLEVLNISPPECVNPDSSFYTRLTLATLGPMVAVLIAVAAFHGYQRYQLYRRRGAAARQAGDGNGSKKFEWAYVLLFLEFVLSGVSTVVYTAFVCRPSFGRAANPHVRLV